ncbi:MAG: hypothetical protein AAGG11_24910 [Pseudomonadota bacterium]
MNRQEAEALLPWHLAGTLSADEAQAVQAFIDSGEIAEAELNELKFIAAEVAEVTPSEPSYNPQLLDRVLTQLDTVPQEAIAEPVAEVAPAAAPPGWLDRLRTALQWQATPTTARWALGAQFALVAALAVLVAAGPQQAVAPGKGGYDTVAAPGTAPITASFSVEFAAAATTSEISGALERLDLQIVGGPSSIGLYELAAPAAADLDALRLELEAAPSVTLVLPLKPL